MYYREYFFTTRKLHITFVYHRGNAKYNEINFKQLSESNFNNLYQTVKKYYSKTNFVKHNPIIGKNDIHI